jgi:hypothetical protein
MDADQSDWQGRHDEEQFDPGEPCVAISGKVTSLCQTEVRRPLLKAADLPKDRPSTRLRSTLDEAPEVHDLAERSDISLRQARELLSRFRGDQAAINIQIAILKRAATALDQS